jgi:hypothetical protein
LMHERHAKNKTMIMTTYRSLIKEWIAQRRIWEYTIAMNLYLSENFTIIWLRNMSEKDLISYHTVIPKNVVDEIRLNTTLFTSTQKEQLLSSKFNFWNNHLNRNSYTLLSQFIVSEFFFFILWYQECFFERDLRLTWS